MSDIGIILVLLALFSTIIVCAFCGIDPETEVFKRKRGKDE